MTKLVKILAIALGTLLGVLVVAAIAVGLLFDPNDYKGYVETYVKKTTGRNLELAEDLHLAYFPWLAVETGGITLGNAPGFEAEPFATIDRAAVRVRLLPLLDRKVEIGTITLDGLALNLGVNGAGRGNWEDLTGGGSEPTTGAPASNGASTLESIDIAGLTVRNGTIAWRENTNELRYTVANLSLTTGRIAIGAPLDLAASFELTDVAAATSLRLELSGGLEIDADGAVNARDIDANFGVTDREAPERATGHLQLAALSIPADRRIQTSTAVLTTRLAAPPFGPDPLELEVDWSGAAFDTTAQTLAIEGLKTRANGVEAEWSLSARDLLRAPALTGTLAVGEAPIATLLDWLNVSLPAGTDARTLGNVAVRTSFDATIDSNHIALTDLSVRGLGLELTGDVGLEGNELDARVDVPAFAPNAGLASLLRAYLPGDVDTTAFVRLAFAGRIGANLETGNFEIADLRAEALDAVLEGSVEGVAAGQGMLYRGSLKSSRFPPGSFVKAFRAWLAAPVAPEEMGTLAIDTQFAYDTSRDALTLDPMAAELFGLSGHGQLAVADLTGSPVVTGELAVERFAPRELFRRFGAAVPDTSDAKALGTASLTTRLRVDADRGRFENIVLMLDDSRITGDFTVDGFQDSAYRFALAIDRVDADRYLPPRADEAQQGEATAGDIELPVDALESLNLEGHVDVGHLELAGLAFDDVTTDLALGARRAALSGARARLYGGAFDGGLSVDARGGTPALALNGKATDLTLAPLIHALTGEAANVSGTGSFDLSLAGTGATVMDNVRTAAGNVSFALENGAIDGFNLGRTLCAVYNSTQKVAQPARADDVTAFQAIRGTAKVTNGVAQSNDLLARTPFMDVTGKGSLGLAEQRLDYDLVAKLTGPIAIAGCESMRPLIGDSIPLTLRGTLTEPEIRPDFSEILRQRLREEAEKSITNRLQQRLQDLIQQR